jgi:hypothetical protein
MELVLPHQADGQGVPSVSEDLVGRRGVLIPDAQCGAAAGGAVLHRYSARSDIFVAKDEAEGDNRCVAGGSIYIYPGMFVPGYSSVSAPVDCEGIS